MIQQKHICYDDGGTFSWWGEPAGRLTGDYRHTSDGERYYAMEVMRRRRHGFSCLEHTAELVVEWIPGDRLRWVEERHSDNVEDIIREAACD